MAESTTAERKHHPTGHRLRKEREQGNVAVSRDLAASAGLLAATGVIISTGSWMLHQMNVWIVSNLSRLGDAGLKPLGESDLTQLVTRAAMFLGLTVGPVAGAAAGTALLLSGMQTNFNFSTAAIKVDFGRLSPAKGLQRFTPARTGVDTLKTMVTAIVLVWLSWPVVKGLVFETERLAWTGTIASVNHGWEQALRLLWRAGFALLALGAADYGIQKWRYIEQLKMTDQELKDDLKHNESNPEVKARIRKIRRELFRSRMMKAVPNATVVLTNPTHFAVALEYKREKSIAPVVVAKGKDLVAAKIREIARQHSVPIIENPSLTRALFKECEIGDTIPGPLFGAVAEVLAYLIRIKQLVL
jgi:flagellar biosynthetic protein FlhB